MLDPEGEKAGIISKPSGLRGEVNIILEPEAGIYIKPDTPLFIEIDGQRVPFFIEEAELVSKDHAIVKFEFIDTLESAREVAGCFLYFDPRQKSRSAGAANDLSYLTGYMASDRESGLLGKITDYLPHPMNPVFVIATEKGELMVPAVRDFIESISTEEQSVQFILPNGLTAL
jgi:16S rRNA processing protein RimM